MRRALLNAKFSINYLLTASRSSSTPIPNTQISPSFSYPSKFRFFSALNENPSTDKLNPNSESTTVSPPPPKDFKFQDVSSNKGLKTDTTIEHDAEFKQMHPKTLNVMGFGMHLLNNPDVLFEMVNHPKFREIADQNPEISHMLNINPVILRRAFEDLRIELETNPKDMREMMGGLDRLLRSIDEKGPEANSNPFAAFFGLGGAAQNQAANPATTGDDLGGSETTTGSPALSTDPLSNLWAAGAGTSNATNPTGFGMSPLPDDGVDDVSNPECITFNVRSLNGTNFVVKANLEMSVKAFKSVLAHNCDVPTTEQRLVYKGRVLDDDETLMSYGLEADHTVHLVRGSGGISWNERTPYRALGPRGYLFRARLDSYPQFSNIIDNPEFKNMFPEQMNIEQWLTVCETLFSELTKGPVPAEEKYASELAQLKEMGFLNSRENLEAVTAHGGDMYATVELLRVLSAFH